MKITRILLGISGGIAAYKTPDLVRLMVSAGVDVEVVMSKDAQHFVTPATLQAVSRHPVHTSLWTSDYADGMTHIHLSRQADALLIAPASANFIAKLAQGGADDLISALCLARRCPLFVAPAMNKEMWDKPATQRNIQQLLQDDVIVLGPSHGEQACGEIGMGKMLDVESIWQRIQIQLQPKPLQGKRVMISAGATLELFDPIRAITNLSSGKMGRAMVQAAQELGAEITLIRGITSIEFPSNITCINVRSAQEMRQAVLTNIAGQDVFVSVAAVADYRPQKTHSEKFKKKQANLTLRLVANPDILSEVANLAIAPFCVGFAAETSNVLVQAQQKRLAKKLPLIVANDALSSLGADEVSVTLLDDTGEHVIAQAPKIEVARLIWQHISTMIGC